MNRIASSVDEVIADIPFQTNIDRVSRAFSNKNYAEVKLVSFAFANAPHVHNESQMDFYVDTLLPLENVYKGNDRSFSDADERQPIRRIRRYRRVASVETIFRPRGPR